MKNNKKYFSILAFLLILLVVIIKISAVNVCCQQTNSGELCTWADSSECNPAFSSSPNLCFNPQNPTLNPSWCRTGWCFDSTEGTCTPNTLSSQCSGEFLESYDADKCDRGCCTLGNEKKYVTETTCDILSKTQGFGNENNFNPDISKEQCRSFRPVEGACLYSDGTCIPKTEQECLDFDVQIRGVDFKPGIFCSDPSLDTGNVPHFAKKCFPGTSEDIYWVDDKNNREDVAEDCVEFVEQCAYDNSGNAYCKGKTCEDKQGNTRKNGESWCDYDGYVGDGKDAVGSTHWRLTCDDGEIEVDKCGGDYRDEVCAEEKLADGSSRSQCRKNLGGNCFSIDNENDCKNVEDCRWGEVDVTNNGDDSFKFGVCVPKYPRGFNLATGETSVPGETAAGVCGLATQTCTMVEQKGWDLSWDCKINCECAKKSFVEQMNNFCTSLGDCGAYVNFAGEGTNNYKVTGKSYMRWESKCTDANVCDYQCTRTELNNNFGIQQPPPVCPQGHRCETKNECDAFNSNCVDVFYDCSGSGYAGTDPSLGFFNQFQCMARGLCVNGEYQLSGKVRWQDYVAGLSRTNIIGQNTPIYMNILREIGGNGEERNLGNELAPNYRNLNSWWEVGFSGQFEITDILLPGISRFIIKPLFNIGGTRERTVKFECLPWQPPLGGDSCELCNSDPDKPCTNYRCQSLGSSCEAESAVANYETENKVCLDSCRSSGDIAFPILSLRSLNTGYIFTPTSRGGNIETSTGQCVQELTKLNLSFLTNELSRCVWSDHPLGNIQNWDEDTLSSFDFDEDNYFSMTHNKTIRPQGEGNFRMYVRCTDRCGWYNTDDYIVDICLSPQPDTTEPFIEGFSPSDNSYLRYGDESVNATVYLDEPAECKYSLTPYQDFANMAGTMSCNNQESEDDFYTDEFFCDMRVNGLTQQENRIYIRCNDSSGNYHTQDQTYILKKTSTPLVISPINPQEGEIREEAVSETAPLILKVQTSGGIGGKAVCRQSFKGNAVSWTDTFTTTGGTTHEYTYTNMPNDIYEIKIVCDDEYGNRAEKLIHFTMDVDNEHPKITNQTEQGSSLILTTDEEAVCYYRNDYCGFDFVNATKKITTGRSTSHQIDNYDNKLSYHVECIDKWGNKGCAGTVGATVNNDGKAPEIIRIFYDSEYTGDLELITDEDAQCFYSTESCVFDANRGINMTEGAGQGIYSTVHFAEWNPKTRYYIKCRDYWNNGIGDSCLAVVEAFDIIQSNL